MQLEQFGKAKDAQTAYFCELDSLNEEINKISIKNPNIRLVIEALQDNITYGGTLDLLEDILADDIQDVEIGQPVPEEMRVSNYASDDQYIITADIQGDDDDWSQIVLAIEWDYGNIVTNVGISQTL